MNEWCIAVFWVLFGSLIYQSWFMRRLTGLFRSEAKRQSQPNHATNQSFALVDAYCPKTTIILSLRGADPFLADCVQGLLRQDYPNYKLQIVVDSPTDPAWGVVNQIIQNNPHRVPVNVSLLTDRRETCGLRCSAVIQVVTSQLDSDCEVVAIVDADVIPAPTWLRHLVAPLADAKVGVATGNRWYAPSSNQLGDWVRYLWNVSSLVVMQVGGVPWGGTLALRVETIRKLHLLEQWQITFVDDVPLQRLMKLHKLKVQLVPSLIMINREECDFFTFLRWASRQQLLLRLYSPDWQQLLVSGLVFASFPIMAIALFLWVLLTGQTIAFLWLGSGLALYFMGSVLLLRALDRSIWFVTQGSAQTSPMLTPMAGCKLLLTSIIMSPILITTTLWAARISEVLWRGVRYRISKNDREIRILDYQPYRAELAPDGTLGGAAVYAKTSLY